MSMSWRDSTEPLPFLSPRVLDTIAASQPAPLPRYRAPLHRFLLSLAISGALFTVPVVGLALLTGR